MNPYEERVRDFIAKQQVDKLGLRELLIKVVRYEFGNLMAADHMIPKYLPERYSSLIFEDHFASTYLLQWPAGKPGTEIHNHGQSAGAVVVLCGDVKETIYRRMGIPRTRILRAGQVISFDQRYIHKFEDGGAREGLSLHFYEPPLTYMHYYRYYMGVLLRSGGWKEGQ